MYLQFMRGVIFSLMFAAIPVAAFAQAGWKDCATAQQYTLQQNDSTTAVTAAISLCYDTYAFRLTIQKKTWYTGIVRYNQHLENGYLVEEFYSEESNHYPHSELYFHIVRSTPATVSVTHISTGETWEFQSKELTEVKLEAHR